ncbi:MAG: VCBS repeat-containing protein [Candidatus Hydrogenedentes bacterium]|nr:VCBS repeat-containing protein [Candidatus Hydrogenedentota bacterium]
MKHSCVACTIVLSCWATFPLPGTAEPAQYVLNTGENVWDVAVEDINGDQRKDILAATSPRLAMKRASP